MGFLLQSAPYETRSGGSSSNLLAEASAMADRGNDISLTALGRSSTLHVLVLFRMILSRLSFLDTVIYPGSP